MNKKQSGLFWHVHHNILLEWCYDYTGRVRYIKTQKTEHERELRLKLFQPVKGKLPKILIEAHQKCVEADQKRTEAYQKCVEADQKRIEALKKHTPEIEALHRIECPNCPWDGVTIFTGGAQ